MAAKLFRKKPVTIEAWHVHNQRALLDCRNWVKSHGGKMTVVDLNSMPIYGSIHTLEGEMDVVIPCYVIRGMEGQFYPCKEAVFQATYEPVVVHEPAL